MAGTVTAIAAAPTAARSETAVATAPTPIAVAACSA